MGSAEKIRHLKLVIGAVDVSVPRESFSAPEVGDGLPKGAITELIGPKKFEWISSLLKQHPEIKVFWAEPVQKVLPTALRQRGVDLERITFATLGDDLFVPLRKVIQSGVYEIVIAPNIFKELKMIRAFQLLTEKSNVSLILTAQNKLSDAWPISLQLDVRGSNQNFEIEVVKQKYGRVE
ncbi:MAG: hypothetical protein ACXVAX_10580 [Pseudobdellovibrio sp.]